MKKIKTLLLALIFCTASLSVIILGNAAQPKENKTGSEVFTTGFMFTVKAYEGKVAVFTYGESVPIEILDCPLSSLPEQQAELLEAGIDITGTDRLQQIIEAFD